MNIRRIISVVLFIGVILVLTGCGGDKKEDKNTWPTRTPAGRQDMAGSKVTSEFKGISYEAEIAEGGITMSSSGLPVFDGIIAGTQVVNNTAYANWESMTFRASTTVRILEYDAQNNKFLVDGSVEMLGAAGGESLFLAPGAIIENATANQEPVSLAPLLGVATYELAYGDIVQIDASGNFVPQEKSESE